ncbi:MAG: hypothetical protein AAF307_05675 [Pseudomonadota bacterium]
MTQRTPITLAMALALVCAVAVPSWAITGQEDPGSPAKDPPVETPTENTDTDPVTETPTEDDDPVTETPVDDDDPVTETPVEDDDPSTGNDRDDKLTKEFDKPGRETPKTAVVTPRNNVETMIYPHHSKQNFCPAGLQPVTISGVISCGNPNKAVSYQQMLRHPKPARVHKPARAKKKTYHRSAHPTCTPGLKGCSDR